MVLLNKIEEISLVDQIFGLRDRRRSLSGCAPLPRHTRMWLGGAHASVLIKGWSMASRSHRTRFLVYQTVVLLRKFEKPGSRDDFDYPQMAEESVKAALKDGGVSYKDIQQAYVGYVYGR